MSKGDEDDEEEDYIVVSEFEGGTALEVRSHESPHFPFVHVFILPKNQTRLLLQALSSV
jgi:hypothetical protein